MRLGQGIGVTVAVALAGVGLAIGVVGGHGHTGPAGLVRTTGSASPDDPPPTDPPTTTPVDPSGPPVESAAQGGTQPGPTPVITASHAAVAGRRPSVIVPPPASAVAAPVMGTRAAPGEGGGSDGWAVIVGIQDYQGSTHHTLGGRGDAAAFAELLRRKGWPGDHIIQLVDGSATATNIRTAMKWLADHSGPDTFSLFHYSGHVCIQSTGPCGGGHTWLWSVDNRFISGDEFGQAMQGIRGWGWVDVAGCEADAFDRGISSQKRLFTGSSAANEKSYEYEPWHESVWTGLVVDQGMLQGRADSDGDGRVSVQEAVRYGQQQAPGMTSDASQGPQHPQISGGSGTWYLEAGNPTNQPRPAPGPGPGGQPPPSSPPDRCGSLTRGAIHC